MKGLYIGITTPGTTSELRANTLKRVVPSCNWNTIDSDEIFLASARWDRSLWFRFRTGPAVWALNRRVLERLGTDVYDVAWIDKGVCLSPRIVQQIRRQSERLIYYTPDTSFLANRSRFFESTASLYDLIATTKSLELADYHRLVARDRIALVTQSFDSNLHYPRCSFGQKRKEAVLIGLCEPSRERCVQQLISQGITVRIGGRGWQPFLRKHRRNSLLRFEGEAVFGERYAQALSEAMVGLGLLTNRFRELHTTRSFEIPACGTALATERTSEISSIFGEEEAIYFSDFVELGHRVSELFQNETQLKTISEAGTARVLAGHYHNDGVLRNLLSRVGIPCSPEPNLKDTVGSATPIKLHTSNDIKRLWTRP